MSNELVYIRKLVSELNAVHQENKQLKNEFNDFKNQAEIRIKALEDSVAAEKRMRNYYYYKSLTPDRYEDALKEWFFQKLGTYPDLKNPKGYNEKIQWIKLHDSTQLKADLTDKYKVRSYVRSKIGEKYLIPLLGVWEKPDDIPFNKLPAQFVLKANHGCGYNIIVKDKSLLNVQEAKSKLLYWLGIDYAFWSGLELHYSLIRRKITAEQYIENIDGDVFDYKVFCFNGKAKYIMFLSDRKKELKMAFFDTQWNRMPVTYNYKPLESNVPKPDNLNELLQAAEALSAGFPHVRVDFYILNSGEIKFGEMTFTSMSGICKWNPPEYDRIFGDLIELPGLKKESD